MFIERITSMDVESPREPVVIFIQTMSERTPSTQAGC